MHTDFQVKSIDAKRFSQLFDLPDEALAQLGAVRKTVTQKPGFPCRVSLEDAGIGEEVILLPYEHHAVNSPYQSKGPVYIRKQARPARLEKNTLPDMLEPGELPERLTFLKNAVSFISFMFVMENKIYST